MQFQGTCIAVEDSSYQSKKSGLVPQMTLTCFDADTVSRLKDTVDVVLSKEEYDRIKEHPLNKTFNFRCERFARDAAHGFGLIVAWTQRGLRQNKFH
jgi:hypothetical protein